MIKKYPLLAVLFSLGLLVTTMIISGVSFGGICDVEGSGCSLVQTSKYATTLGIPNTYLGFAGFLVLIILTIAQIRNPSVNTKKYLTYLLTLIALFALYFIILQAFVLKTFCTFCMIVDTIVIISAILFYLLKD